MSTAGGEYHHVASRSRDGAKRGPNVAKLTSKAVTQTPIVIRDANHSSEEIYRIRNTPLLATRHSNSDGGMKEASTR